MNKGLDPKHVIWDREQKDIIYVRGDDRLERVAGERASPVGASGRGS